MAPRHVRSLALGLSPGEESPCSLQATHEQRLVLETLGKARRAGVIVTQLTKLAKALSKPQAVSYQLMTLQVGRGGGGREAGCLCAACKVTIKK